jgi:hypothetical protein
VKPQHLQVKEIYKEASKPASFTVNESWKLITTEELKNQETLLKNAPLTNSLSLNNLNNKENFNSMTIKDRDRIRTQLTPAQIFKIIVSKYLTLNFFGC